MRYIRKDGRFGAYFYDTIEKRDVDLNEALEIMNKFDQNKAKLLYNFDPYYNR